MLVLSAALRNCRLFDHTNTLWALLHSFCIHTFQCHLAGLQRSSAVPIKIRDCKWLIRPLYCQNKPLINIAEGIFREISLLEIKISPLVREKSLLFSYYLSANHFRGLRICRKKQLSLKTSVLLSCFLT